MWISTTTSVGSMCSLSTLDEFQRTIYFTSSFRRCAIRLPLRIGYLTYYLPRQSVYLHNLIEIIFTLQNFMGLCPDPKEIWIEVVQKVIKTPHKPFNVQKRIFSLKSMWNVFSFCVSHHPQAWQGMNKPAHSSQKRKIVCFLSKLPDIMCKVQLERAVLHGVLQ